MATASPRTTGIDSTGETRTLVRGVGWEGCLALLDWFGDDGPKMAYAGGDLEFMTPRMPHEEFKTNLSFVLEAIFEGLSIRFRPLASTTFTRRSVERMVEPDQCYYLRHKPRQIAGRKGVDLDNTPPPDLCIEIEITSSLLPKLDAHARMGFPELWRYDGESLSILVRDGETGSYRAAERSACLPFVPVADVAGWLGSYDDGDDLAWRQRVRAWVVGTVEPLARAGRAGAG